MVDVTLAEFRKSVAYRFTQPMARFLARTHVTPNVITWFGFFLAIGAAVLIAAEYLFAAGFLVLVASFFDAMDGALARYTDRVTRFGAVLDSTLDRLSEAVLLIGILVLFARDQSFVGILLVAITLVGSLLVSYIRARAEALGLKCEVGLLTRPERVIILVLGLWLSQIDYALIIALAIIAVLSFITAGQRLVYVWQQTKAK